MPTVPELRALARTHGLRGYSKLNKRELLILVGGYLTEEARSPVAPIELVVVTYEDEEQGPILYVLPLQLIQNYELFLQMVKTPPEAREDYDLHAVISTIAIHTLPYPECLEGYEPAPQEDIVKVLVAWG